MTRRIAAWPAWAAALCLCLALGTARSTVLTPQDAAMVVSDAPTPPPADAPWRPVRLPDNWRLSQPGLTGATSWYRIDFDVPEGATRGTAWAVYLPYFYDGAQLFLNGAPLATIRGSDARTRVLWVRPHLVPVPDPLLRPGPNRLTIRATQHAPWATLSRRQRRGCRRTAAAHERRLFWMRTRPQVTAVTSGLMAVFILFVWWRRPQETLYGLLGLASRPATRRAAAAASRTCSGTPGRSARRSRSAPARRAPASCCSWPADAAGTTNETKRRAARRGRETGAADSARHRPHRMTTMETRTPLDALTAPNVRDDGAIAAAQRAIVAALRSGASFSTAHKEGGTTIRFDGRDYLREDFGESPSLTRFATDEELLAFLRRFYHHEVLRDAGPAGVSEAEAWRWIQRRLEWPRGAAAASALSRLSPGARMAAVLGLVMLVFVAIGSVAWWHESRQRTATPPRPSIAPAPLLPRPAVQDRTIRFDLTTSR